MAIHDNPVLGRRRVGDAAAILLGALMLAGCAASPESAAMISPTGPTHSTSFPGTGFNRELETKNSLPPGFATSNTIAPATGVIGRTSVP